MSGLNPGGSRSKSRRVFTASDVARVCRQAKIAEVDKAGGSIAGREHKQSREVERRLRQAARRNGKSV